MLARAPSLVFVVGLLLALALGAPAFAAPPGDDIESMPEEMRLEHAREMFTQGRRSFAAGAYEAAIEQFRAGYRYSRQPLFLYNIAAAARRAGKLEVARDHYRQFLAVAPDAAEAKSVAQVLAEVERELAAARPTPPVARPPVVAPPTAPPVLPPVLAPPPVLPPAMLVAPPLSAVARPATRRRWLWPVVGVSIGVAVAIAVAVPVALYAHGTDFAADQRERCNGGGCVVLEVSP